MKLTILASSLALCGGIAFAQDPATTAPEQTKRTVDKKIGDHKMTAEVVSADATAQQITVRKLTMGETVRFTGSQSTAELPPPDSAPTFTLKVDGKALTRLSTVKAGDQVTISCRSQGSAPADSSAAAGMGSISSQAMADAHCATVTDISAAKIKN